MRTLVSALGFLVFLYAVLCLLAFLFQRRLVYFPDAGLEVTPEAVGLVYKDAHFNASDGTMLHAWFLPAREAKATVLICHGNAGNISHRMTLASTFVNMGFSVLLFDYRGYGRSEGDPTEEGTYRDAEAAWEYLVAERGLAPRRIVVHGESIGAAVAVELATRREVAGLVLESPFLSIPEVGARAYPWLPVRWLARVQYDNLEKIGDLRIPLLFIHSPSDEIVPFDHTRRLFERATTDKRLLQTEGGHNDGGFLSRPEWRQQVREFVERVTG